MEGFIKSKPSGPLRVISLQLADRFSAPSTFSFSSQLCFPTKYQKILGNTAKNFVT
jgi:hypothetical protein